MVGSGHGLTCMLAVWGLATTATWVRPQDARLRSQGASHNDPNPAAGAHTTVLRRSICNSRQGRCATSAHSSAPARALPRSACTRKPANQQGVPTGVHLIPGKRLSEASQVRVTLLHVADAQGEHHKARRCLCKGWGPGHPSQ